MVYETIFYDTILLKNDTSDRICHPERKEKSGSAKKPSRTVCVLVIVRGSSFSG